MKVIFQNWKIRGFILRWKNRKSLLQQKRHTNIKFKECSFSSGFVQMKRHMQRLFKKLVVQNHCRFKLKTPQRRQIIYYLNIKQFFWNTSLWRLFFIVSKTVKNPNIVFVVILQIRGLTLWLLLINTALWFIMNAMLFNLSRKRSLA